MAVDLRKFQYLIIDDFADMRSMIRSMLVSYGVSRMDMAANGKDAVNLLSKGNYDVILCDYNLGDGKDGQQVLEEARDKNYIRYDTAFLMLTAENTMEMVMGAVEYLPDDYLSKPFNKDMLRSRLEKVIERKMELADVVKKYQKGLYGEALEICDKKIEHNPRSATEILKFKAEILMKTARYEEAGAIYEKILAKRDVPWAMVGLGKVRFHAHQYLDAKNIFQRIIEINKTHMEAYDWLAKSMVALGDKKEAIGVLSAATEISPKSILRQTELGNLAYEEQDMEVAGKAFKKAVQIGCNSIYQAPANYTKLARIQSKTSGKDAMSTLSKLRNDYGRSDEANLHAALAESETLRGMGRENDAKKAYAEANSLYKKASVKFSRDIVMEMANASIANGEKERGVEILRGLVMNHHADNGLLKQVQDIFSSAGIPDEGQLVIKSAIKEVVDLNNRGTELAKAGKLDEAISLLEKAVGNMPDNSTINLNIANVLLMYIKANGKNDSLLYKARQYLDHAHRIDPDNENYMKTQDIYERIMSS